MYAVVEQGGRQYMVAAGDVIEIDLAEVDQDAAQLEMDKVLFVSSDAENKLGNPYIEGAKVIAKFEKTAQDAVVKGKKIYGMSFRRRKNSKRKMGHRQKYMRVVIDKIEA